VKIDADRFRVRPGERVRLKLAYPRPDAARRRELLALRRLLAK
jgi:hypothetical protein